MKIVSIVGARPEFVQAAPVSKALRDAQHTEVLVHTGQHYDYVMSQAFFDQLGIPAPDHNLEIGSGLHGQQTGDMLTRIEQVLMLEHPDLVIVRGDTNSTLAGALASSKLHIPTAHIEAGERSFDRRMPEEINRLVADHLADLHLCVSHAAISHLADEGIVTSAHWTGDVMLDALLQNHPIARRRLDTLTRLDLRAGDYALVTIHRAANTDDVARLKQIVQALNSVHETIVFPAHPRTRKVLAQIDTCLRDHIKLIEPVSYLDMMVLEENARLIATDSGGVQREAYYLCKPCLTLRDETEWVETVKAGWNKLVGVEPERIADVWHSFIPPAEHPPIYGDGTAALRIAELLTSGQVAFGASRRPNESSVRLTGGV